MDNYSEPMRPWPNLEPYSRTVRLRRSASSLWCFDTGATQKPSILMLHGLGDEADSWRHLFPLLADRFRLIAPDLPGFGRSQLPGGPLTPSLLAGVILELMNVLQIERALLVGSSMGAMLCHYLALSHPQRATGLVLIGGTLVAGSNPLNHQLLMFLLPGIGEWLYTRFRRNPRAAYDSLRPYYADLERMPDVDQEFLYRRVNQRVWSNRQRKAYFSALRRMALWVPRQQSMLPTQLAASKIPTLLIWGQQDHIVGPSPVDAHLRLQPAASQITIAGAGHLPHQEQPGKVVDAMQQSGLISI